MDVSVKSVYDELLDFLAANLPAEKIIAFKVSHKTQERVQYLLEANRNGTLTPEENAELDDYEQLNHLMILLKARAHQHLQK